MNGFLIVNYGTHRAPGYESTATMEDAVEIYNDSYELLREPGDVVELLKIVDGVISIHSSMRR